VLAEAQGATSPNLNGRTVVPLDTCGGYSMLSAEVSTIHTVDEGLDDSALSRFQYSKTIKCPYLRGSDHETVVPTFFFCDIVLDGFDLGARADFGSCALARFASGWRSRIN
jgi:hypothetical protein